MSDVNIDNVKKYLIHLQDSICDALTQEDGEKSFLEDAWQRKEGGGGRSRVLVEGAVFESAGINFSHVHGAGLPDRRDRQPPRAPHRLPVGRRGAGRSGQHDHPVHDPSPAAPAPGDRSLPWGGA